LTVSIGDTIVWVNDDENIHTATHRRDPALFDSGTMEAGDEFSFTFSEEGEVRYFCRFHPWMTGVITVQN
jgi:plastocyanin